MCVVEKHGLHQRQDHRERSLDGKSNVIATQSSQPPS